MTQLLTLRQDARGVTTLTINRPEVHNAFNAELIARLSETLDRLVDEDRTRVLVLTGAGVSFSAGADLNWMRGMVQGSEADNRADARALAAMLRKLDQFPRPTIARVNGPAFGGGVGLIACCDIVVAVHDAKFGLTEVRLGLAPATIAPFVIRRIGVSAARRYMLTGERFNTATAQAIGLINKVVGADSLDCHVERLLKQLLAGGQTAQGHVKTLIRLVEDLQGAPEELDRRTSEMIAALRVSSEGQEGLNAFLEKRKPDWT
ncbi:MAG: enoyl-CoA hydratase-related protein [Pseudomonadota bacterium]